MAALFLSSFRQLGNRKGRANSTATGTTNNTNDPGCSSSGSGGSIAATGGASNSIGSDVQQMRPTPKSGNSSSLLSRSRSRTNHSRPSAKSKADSRRRRRRTKDEPFDDSDESGGEIWLDPRIPIRDQLDKLQAYHSRKNQTSVNGTAAAATTNKPSGAPPQVTDDPFLHDFASRIAAETINGGKSGADRLGRANSVSRKRGDSGEDSMLGICICCSTQLRYPVNQQCFKCSVCETINDLVPWSPFGAGGGTDAKPEDGQKRPPPLTLSRLNEGIDEYRQRPEKLSLLEVMVRESFSYAEVLNRSFMCGEVGAESPGLDWVELREAYRTLLGLPVSIIRAMMNGIEASLRRPGRPMRHKEDIRFLVIILENPLLLQNEFPQEAHYHHQILKRVLGFIGNLPYRLHCTLVSWFLGAPSSSFQSKIQMANQFISYRLTRHYYSAQKGDRLSPQNSRIQQPSDAGGAGGSIGTDISGRGNGRTRSITMAVPTSPTVDNSLQQQSPVGSALHEQRPSRSSGLAPPALTTRDTHDNNGAAGASSIARVYIVEPEPLSPQFSKELAARRRNRSRAHANTVIIGESMNKKNHQPPAVEQTQSISLSPSASFRSKRAAGSGEATKFPNLVGDSAATATATEPSAIRDTMYQPADGVGDSASALAGDPSATSQLLASGQSITTTLRGTKSVRRILGTRQYSPPDVTSPRSREAFEEEQRIAFGIIDDDHGFGEFSNVAPSRQTPLPSSLQSRPGALSTLEAGNMGLGPVPPALKSPASVARAPWLASGAGSGASGSTTDSVAQNGADSSLHLGTGSTAATPIIPSSRPILNLDPRGSPVNMESMISDIFNRHYSVSVPSLQDGDNAAKSSPEEKNTTFNASLLSPAAVTRREISGLSVSSSLSPARPNSFRSHSSQLNTVRTHARQRSLSAGEFGSCSSMGSVSSSTAASVSLSQPFPSPDYSMELRSTASKTASGGVAQAHFDTSNRLSRTVHFRPGYHRNRSQSESHRVNPFSTARTQPGPSAPSANALTLPAMRGLDMSDYVVGDDGVFYFKSKQLVPYEKDWRLLSACKFMALLFKTNQLRSCRSNRFGLSEFYNPYLYSDRRDTMTINILEDFDAWQSEKSRQIFCFCQYPFILSGDAKMYIMRMDSSRQMAQKHKEALFSAFFLDSSLNAHLKLNVRRNCLVEDSLTQLNSQQTDLKKRLKISFVGEDGVDAGGLTKEWFMLLLRELMNPLYGMFNLEDNNMTWFNMASLESSDQFFLVGVVIGLALYNAQLLDLRLPLVVYKKLLGQGAYGKSSSGGPLCGMPGVTDVTSAPAPKVTGGLATSSAGLGMYGGIEAASSSGLLSRDAQIRAQIYEMLEDLSDFRPQVTKGLRDLLHYKGDVENDFCLTYQVTYEAFGRTHAVDLVADGKDKLVTKANRLDYIHRYLNWVLNDSIQRQFEPFRRGFFYVCGGNALSLFRAEEIESIVRGSDESITLEQLREAVVKVHPMVEQWFWRAMENMSDAMRRKFLVFVTGTDRLPAVGKLDIKVALLGEDVTGRFPTAHTCFNQLGMWLYPSYEMFEDRLFRAISESEGFGIK